MVDGAGEDGTDSGLPAEQKRARHMQGKRKKRRLCDKFVATGVCKFGDSCKFSHDIKEATKQTEVTAQNGDVSKLLENGSAESEQKRKSETDPIAVVDATMVPL